MGKHIVIIPDCDGVIVGSPVEAARLAEARNLPVKYDERLSRFSVIGSNGDLYYITTQMLSHDEQLWSCTCPARGICKHLRAVLDLMDSSV